MEEMIYISPPRLSPLPPQIFFALILSFKNIVCLVIELLGVPLSPAAEAGTSLLPQPGLGWRRHFCLRKCPWVASLRPRSVFSGSDCRRPLGSGGCSSYSATGAATMAQVGCGHPQALPRRRGASQAPGALLCPAQARGLLPTLILQPAESRPLGCSPQNPDSGPQKTRTCPLLEASTAEGCREHSMKKSLGNIRPQRLAWSQLE